MRGHTQRAVVTGGIEMPKRFMAVIFREEEWYVAHCVEPGVVRQGKTIVEGGYSFRFFTSS